MTLHIVPLFGTGNVGRSKTVSAQRRVNMYTEAQKDTDKSGLPLYQRPGLRPFTCPVDNALGYTLIPGPIRGGVTVSYVANAVPDPSNPGLRTALTQYGIVAAGNSLYVFDPGVGTLRAIGNGDVDSPRNLLLTSSGQMQFADNGAQVMAVDGTTGYIAVYSTAFSGSGGQITDADFPPLPTSVTFLADRFVVNTQAYPGRFYWSDVSTGSGGLSWDALNFATAESNPDPLNCVFEAGGSLLLIGTRTTEFWAPSTGTAAYARVGGSGIDWGSSARDTVRKFQGGVVMLARNLGGARQVISISGYTPQVISTPDVELSINADPNPDGAVATVTTINGHPFYILNLTNTSWVFNAQAGTWDEWQSGGRWAGQYVIPWFNSTQYVSDYSGEALYTLDADYQYDGSELISRELISRHIFNDFERFTLNKLTVDAQVGQASVTPTSYPYAVVLDSGGLNIGHTNNNAVPASASFSIRCWLRILDTSGGVGFILFSKAAAGNGWSLECISNTLRFQAENGEEAHVAYSNTFVWDQLTITYDAVAQVMKFYLNGVLTSTTSSFVTTSGSSTATDFAIGFPNQGTIANVQDVQVWNYVLSPTYIAANLNTQYGAGTPGLVTLFNNFNQTDLVYPNLGSGGGSMTFSASTTFVARNNTLYYGTPRAPQMALQLSKDNGNTWSYEMWEDMGALGDYRKRPTWQRLGRARDVLMRLRVTDPVALVVTGGALALTV